MATYAEEYFEMLNYDNLHPEEKNNDICRLKNKSYDIQSIIEIDVGMHGSASKVAICMRYLQHYFNGNVEVDEIGSIVFNELKKALYSMHADLEEAWNETNYWRKEYLKLKETQVEKQCECGCGNK